MDQQIIQVYQDQIWAKTNCRQFERQVYLDLNYVNNKVVGQTDQNLTVNLVDACKLDLKKFFVTDNILKQDHIALYPEFWGSFYYKPEYISRSPTYLFNCFMNRVCMIRQSWLYQFVRRKLLDQGAVSYLLDYREMPTGVETKQDLNQYIYNLGNHVFETEHNQMQFQVPYCNFFGDLDQIIVDSKVSLVIETYFDWPGIIAFSEKIFRALQLPRPLILFCSPDAVTALRSYKFDLWDDMVDHSYDQIQNPIERQILILDQIEKFQQVSYTSQQLFDFESRAKYNQQLLQKLKQNWPEKLKLVKQKILA